jgi:AcrR family transcriptional regulator
MVQQQDTGGDASLEAPRRRRDPRREQTPKRLVAAARVVFERDGFHNARLSDVTREANVATGTFTTTFSPRRSCSGP